MKLRGLATVAVVSVVVLVAACGGGQPASPPEQAAAPAAPKVLPLDERVTSYMDCWQRFNRKDWEPFTACYAEGAESEQIDSGMPASRGRDAVVAEAKAFTTAFPDISGSGQLVLAGGDMIVGLFLLNGTHTGPLPGPGGKALPATGKKVGYLLGHVLQFDAAGEKVVHEWLYSDSGTLMHQLGMNPQPARPVMEPTGAAPVMVTARGTDVEARNVAAFRAQMEAFNKHDVAAMDAFNAPDAVFHDLTAPKDVDVKGNAQMVDGFFKSFPDARLSADRVWGAGDYVVGQGIFEGTNTGRSPGLGIQKVTGKPVRLRFLEITRYEDGKVKEDWLIFDSMAMANQLGL